MKHVIALDVSKGKSKMGFMMVSRRLRTELPHNLKCTNVKTVQIVHSVLLIQKQKKATRKLMINENWEEQKDYVRGKL